MNIAEWAGASAGITVTVGGIGAGLSWMYRHVRGYFKRLEQRAAQLEPNGGKSLRDDMTHVRASIDAIGDQVRAVAVDVLGVHSRLERIEQRQDDHDQAHREASVTA